MKHAVKYLCGILFLFASFSLFAQVPNFKWVKKSVGNNTGGYGIARDATGNIYITGGYQDSIEFGTLKLKGNTQGFIAKLDEEGNGIWAVNISDYGSIGAPNILPDGNGYLYISGTYSSSDSVVIAGTQLIDTNVGFTKAFVAKYDTMGNAIWGKGLRGTTYLHQGIATDNAGNVYINDYAATKLNSSGSLLWQHYFSNQYGHLDGSGIGLDAQDNVYATGDDIILGKKNNNGDSIWVRSGGPRCLGVAVAVADSGYIYTCGAFKDSLNLGSFSLTGIMYNKDFMFVAKYDSSGNAIWAVQGGRGMTPGGYPEIKDMTLGASNEVIISGTILDSAYFGNQTLIGTGPFMAAYDAGGELVWAKVASYGSGNNKGNGDARRVVSDMTGNVYVIGSISKTLHFDTISLTSTSGSNMYLAKLSPPTTSIGNKGARKKPVISTWPNPAQHFLNVKASDAVEYKQVSLYDQLGRLVYNADIEKGQNIKPINIGNVANGVYYLRLTGEYGSETKKILIEQ